MFDLEFEAQDLEYSAEWRREKAKQYPEDWRNIAAAELLDKIAMEVRAMEGSEIHCQISAAINERLDAKGDFGSFFEEWSDYKRRIGFWEFPSGKEYLSDMLKGMLKYWHHVSEEIAD